MNIKELKLAIRDLPDDMGVIIQKDAEGNGYSPLQGADEDGIYVPDSTYSGDVYDATLSAEDNGMEEEEWEKLKKQNRSLILFPVN